MRQWIVQFATPILCALALLLGVIALGRVTRAALHDRESFTFTLDEVDFQPPQGLSRGKFLDEVRQLSHTPECWHRLDPDLSSRLARSFAADPWVESVRHVHTGRVGTNVRVELEHRRPVLAVSLAGEKIPRDGSALVETWSGKSRSALVPARAVDGNGVLLPVKAVYSGLPVLVGEVSAPTGPAGRRWNDRRVIAAVATLAYLTPHLSRLHLTDCDIDIVQGEVVFRKPGVRIVWGHAPGREAPAEAPADVKLRRLLDYQAEHDGLESLEHDVRLLAYQGHFPLPAQSKP
jgi:hypothetical protein